MIRMVQIGLWVVLMFSSLGVMSHHSTQVFYDFDNVVEIEGRVTWVLWKNPHVRFNLTRIDGNGREEVWKLEGGSLNTLQRASVGEDVIRVGDFVRAAGPLSSRGLNTIYVSNVLLPDGQEISLQQEQRLRWTSASSVPPIAENSESEVAPLQANGIFRVWTREYGDPRPTLPFTATAIETRVQWDPLTEDPAIRCIPQGIPGAMDNPYPIEFTQQGEDIVLRLEEWDGVRTIHVGTGESVEELLYPHMGYSVGYWEGSTLVVETSNIDYPLFDPTGTPQSEAVEIVERFMISDDEQRLDYQATVTDPETFTEPAVLYQHWVWIPGEEIKPYECTLGEA